MIRSAWGRSVKLMKMAAQVGFKELSSKSLESRLEQARLITDSLAQLRGAAMKAGQLLSLELHDYFPPEAIEILSRLQSNAPAFDPALIQQVLKEDLSSEQLARFENFSHAPIAAASIGQVHCASVEGQPVAIKIQYPGVAESVDADLLALQKLAKAYCLLSGRQNMDLTSLFDEFSRILHQEVNYLLEAENMQKFAGLIQSVEWGEALRFVVPRPLLELTASRVLTMTWEEGEALRDWLKRPQPLVLREKIGRGFLDLYCHELFTWGFVQTDPNFGNFLVRQGQANSHGKDHEVHELVLLDFGATRTYSPQFRKSYVDLIQSVARGNKDEILDQAFRFQLLDPREDEESLDLFIQMMKFSIRPFDIGHTSGNFSNRNRKFKFSDIDFFNDSARITREFTRRLKYSPPPHHLLFLHRKLAGVFAILRKLDVEIDLTPYWNLWLEKASL